ncbi:Na/Pi cotransporter family protein [Musicola keenii]|uniref:Na/Pi cotransporter family protein n=1 Tax=Musicola keenii TaxID=2884250 RepID=UPI0017812A60|nr:Na/Pi cotransporter family protein [Musicola keenii]
MLTLLNLLSAVALLVWGTHIVRSGIMRVFGASLRRVLGHGMAQRWLAFLSGVGVTALVQSSNATTLLVTSFVAQNLVGLSSALVAILGADVGTALMARLLTFDLSWLSPLLLVVGVSLFLGRKTSRAGQLGRVGIGLGLILLALQLIVAATHPITQAAGVKVLFSSLTGDVMLDALLGALFAVIGYSSLAAVLLTATLTASGVISFQVALCLVVGANLGSGLLAMINSSAMNEAARRVALGGLLFKLAGSLLVLPWIPTLANRLAELPLSAEDLTIFFHLFYNLLRCLLMLPFVGPMARLCQRLIADAPPQEGGMKPRHLDAGVLDSPSLALVNAVRETLRMGDVLEQMLHHFGLLIHGAGREEKAVRRLDDDVDVLYNAIKLYLARMPKDDLSAVDSRRWAEVIETALNLEQAGDVIERMSGDVAGKSVAARREFSPQGRKELETLLTQLHEQLRLSLSVFLSRDVESARLLRRAKHRFNLRTRRYAYAHVERLHQRNPQSMETSSLHLELLGDMRRLNSLFCALAYSVLESQGEAPSPEDAVTPPAMTKPDTVADGQEMPPRTAPAAR